VNLFARHFAHPKTSEMALLIRATWTYHRNSCVALEDHRTEKGLSPMGKSNRATRRQARQRQQHIRSAVFAVIVFGVLGLAGYYLYSAFFRPAPPPMAGNVIVKADMAGFDEKIA
jgi:hypothetical protein